MLAICKSCGNTFGYNGYRGFALNKCLCSLCQTHSYRRMTNEEFYAWRHAGKPQIFTSSLLDEYKHYIQGKKEEILKNSLYGYIIDRTSGKKIYVRAYVYDNIETRDAISVVKDTDKKHDLHLKTVDEIVFWRYCLDNISKSTYTNLNQGENIHAIIKEEFKKDEVL